MATAYLALAAWMLGDVEGARKHIERGDQRAVDLAHAPTLAAVYNITAISKSGVATPPRPGPPQKPASRSAESGVSRSGEPTPPYLGLRAREGRDREPP